jgi:23S rRNA (guanosine2251-2'-O)-methyltransferase
MSSSKKSIQVENKNAILELLRADTPFIKIYVASNAFRDSKSKEIFREAQRLNIPVERITRKRINNMSHTTSAESIIAIKPANNVVKLKHILADEEAFRKGFFFIIIDHVKYPQNLGAIMRSAYGAGVDAVIIPNRKANVLTDEVTRISMGTSERIPIVQTNLFSAIKQLQDSAVKVVGVHMEGKEHFKADLKGNVALVLGAEDTGISERVKERCDELVQIPMQEGLGSLNVSASAAIVMFEKKRQDEAEN